MEDSFQRRGDDRTARNLLGVDGEFFDQTHLRAPFFQA